MFWNIYQLVMLASTVRLLVIYLPGSLFLAGMLNFPFMTLQFNLIYILYSVFEDEYVQEPNSGKDFLH